MFMEIPNKYFFCAGACEGETELNALDNAYMAAGVGNTNLIKVSSILPPHCEKVPPFKLPLGALVPIAYAAQVSAKPGDWVCASVAIAYPKNPDLNGLIMEYHGFGRAVDAEALVRKMAEDGYRRRDYPLDRIESKATEWQVQKCGAAFAAVVLWK